MVTLLAESTLPSVYMRKKLTPLLEPRADRLFSRLIQSSFRSHYFPAIICRTFSYNLTLSALKSVALKSHRLLYSFKLSIIDSTIVGLQDHFFTEPDELDFGLAAIFLSQRQQSSRMLWLSRLNGVDPARRAKVFIWRKVGPASYRRVTLPSQKGDPARRVTLLAEPTFCFSCKRFAKFCKEMYEKLARPG